MGRKRSRKQSDGRTARQRQRDLVTIFVDNSIPSASVHQALSEMGFKVIALRDEYASDPGDDEWLEFVGTHRTWVALGRDKQIAKNEIQRKQVETHKVGYFVLAYKHDVSAEDQIEILKKAKGRIIRIKAEYKKPFIAKIDATGEIRMMLGQKAKKKVV